MIMNLEFFNMQLCYLRLTFTRRHHDYEVLPEK